MSSRFHTTERLGAVQSTTREGFLICEGVPISRLGTMPYADGELPKLTAGKDGIVWVTRDEAALFDDESVRSFEGKAVVDLHPYEDVTSENWRKYAVGHVQHVRRGEGDQAHLLVADLVIKDAAAIREVRQGKRHVSLGYTADYEQLEPGRARQVRIVGNHVALVPEGRCGPTCSIGDSAVSIKTLLERLRSAHANKDDGLFATTLAEVDNLAGTAGGAAPGSPVQVHVHTTGDGQAAPAPASPAVPAPPAAPDFQVKTMDALGKITEGMEALTTKLGALETKVVALETAAPAAAPAAPAAAVTAPTADASSLKDAFADAVARAEWLIPGVKAPTFDAAQPAAKQTEVICGFQRQVLAASLTTGTGRQHVEPVMPPGSDVQTMTCDALGMAFRTATELARVTNNRNGAGAGMPGAPDAKPRPATPAEINEANRKYWAKHNGTGQAA